MYRLWWHQKTANFLTMIVNSDLMIIKYVDIQFSIHFRFSFILNFVYLILSLTFLYLGSSLMMILFWRFQELHNTAYDSPLQTNSKLQKTIADTMDRPNYQLWTICFKNNTDRSWVRLIKHSDVQSHSIVLKPENFLRFRK